MLAAIIILSVSTIVLGLLWVSASLELVQQAKPDKNDKVIDLIRGDVIKLTQFAVGNLDPSTVKYWPHEELKRIAHWIDKTAAGPIEKELAIELLKFAAEAEGWEATRGPRKTGMHGQPYASADDEAITSARTVMQALGLMPAPGFPGAVTKTTPAVPAAAAAPAGAASGEIIAGTATLKNGDGPGEPPPAAA